MAIYRGTVGLRISVTVSGGLDISAANGTFSLEAEKPDGTALSWAVTIDDGPAGLCHYDTVEGDLDTPGEMPIQGKWVPISTSNAFYTSIGKLDVKNRAQ